MTGHEKKIASMREDNSYTYFVPRYSKWRMNDFIKHEIQRLIKESKNNLAEKNPDLYALYESVLSGFNRCVDGGSGNIIHGQCLNDILNFPDMVSNYHFPDTLRTVFFNIVLEDVEANFHDPTDAFYSMDIYVEYHYPWYVQGYMRNFFECVNNYDLKGRVKSSVYTQEVIERVINRVLSDEADCMTGEEWIDIADMLFVIEPENYLHFMDLCYKAIVRGDVYKPSLLHKVKTVALPGKGRKEDKGHMVFVYLLLWGNSPVMVYRSYKEAVKAMNKRNKTDKGMLYRIWSVPMKVDDTAL